MARFLHTGDWQLGMTRHFLEGDAQNRYTDARFDAIASLGRLARLADCEFMVVCGDVFESNQVDRRTVRHALDLLAAVPVPVYLLPGNHDPLNAVSVYRSAAFRERRPPQVHVLETPGVVEVRPGLEILAAPWFSKRPGRDLVAAAALDLPPAETTVRVAVAHGAVDALSPDRDDPAVISLAAAERALAENRFHYLALGDRHSVTHVGQTGRIAYAGSPEPTDYDEDRPGCALIVEADANQCTLREEPVGTWSFRREAFALNGAEDLDAVRAWLEGVADKRRTAAKLSFTGALSLGAKAELDRLLDEARELFGGLEIWERRSDLAILPDQGDLDALELSGIARAALERLRILATAGGDEAATAGDALSLLYRLARRSG